MTFDADRLSGLIDEASMDLITLAPENLLELGALLGKVEPLGEAFAPLGSPIPGRIAGALVDLLSAMIRDETPDPAAAADVVGQGLSLLSELSRCLPVEAPFQGDMKGFLQKFSAVMEGAKPREAETEPATAAPDPGPQAAPAAPDPPRSGSSPGKEPL
jgi:hypothetical protein